MRQAAEVVGSSAKVISPDSDGENGLLSNQGEGAWADVMSIEDGVWPFSIDQNALTEIWQRKFMRLWALDLGTRVFQSYLDV